MNLIVISVACAWLINQLLKTVISRSKRNFFECGGMPSSHSAFVSALTTSVCLVEGLNSAIFLITLAFSILVVHDAVRIRKQHKIMDIVVGIVIGISATLLINAIFF
ncbi:MAG: divergent PAP2 family protein [Candidatus Woesearchaeota archaeon]